MAQAGRDGTNILIVGNQQRGGGVPETVQRDNRQGFRVTLVVSKDGIMERLVWGAVIHQLAIFLNEQPFAALPEIAHAQTVPKPVRFHGLDTLGEKMGNGNLAEAVLRLWHFDKLLPLGVPNRLGDRHHVLLKIDVCPFQRQQLPLAETGEQR